MWCCLFVYLFVGLFYRCPFLLNCLLHSLVWQDLGAKKYDIICQLLRDSDIIISLLCGTLQLAPALIIKNLPQIDSHLITDAVLASKVNIEYECFSTIQAFIYNLLH